MLIRTRDQIIIDPTVDSMVVYSLNIVKATGEREMEERSKV